jgi:HK97 family phage portal protein
MGFWDRFRGIDSSDPAQRVLPEGYEPFVSTGGIPVMDPGTPLEVWVGQHRSEVERFWRTQPNLRKVVDFIARSVASIPLNAFERVSDNERVRLSGEPLADTLRRPQPRMSPYRFWHAVLSDGLLYDRWAVITAPNEAGGLDLIHIPSWRLWFKVDPLNRVVAIKYWTGDSVGRGDEQWIDVPLDDVIFDHGYAPRTAGLSPVETLRDILDENAEAVRWRREHWEQGARVPAQVTRPATAPKWEDAHRTRFVEAMRAYTRKGARAGGLPLMEDGMKIEGLDIFKPRDAEDIEGRRLSAVETAAAYHIAPELVGAREGTYSNVDAFRQMLYGPNLGPYVEAWEGALNAQLAPRFAAGRQIYIEANVESKLRGSFIEQAQILQSATGAPYLTRNEARTLSNRSPLPGGDELVIPLNVLVGGQASPQDSAPKARRALKAAPSGNERAKAQEVLAAFFKRQARVVLGALGAKAGADWWDAERWDRELAADLLALSLTVTERSAKRAIEAAGGNPGDYDVDRTVRYLQAVAARTASSINATTKAQLDDAIDDEEADPADVFEQAKGSRSAIAAVTLTTALSGFATAEAGKQSGAATKTWIVTSANARPSHAAMSGETVPISENFSNGMAWPGDSTDADEVAGCTCDVEFTYP